MDEAPWVYATDVVRVFPDHAGSVIWFSEPLPYRETRLTQDLVALLEDWEGQYYAALDPDLRWRPSVSLHDFSARGLDLARAVSTELGPSFAVEYRSFEDREALPGFAASIRPRTPLQRPRSSNAPSEPEPTGRRLAPAWLQVRTLRLGGTREASAPARSSGRTNAGLINLIVRSATGSGSGSVLVERNGLTSKMQPRTSPNARCRCVVLLGPRCSRICIGARGGRRKEARSAAVA
jgi:hypothetical protein